MRIYLRAFIPALLLLVLAVGTFAQRPPHNSYIERRVSGVSDLVRHVRESRVVMDRYRRHFAMSDEEVIAYLSSLRESKLEKDGIYKVYGVPHNSGDFHANMRRLKKGEPVLVEADGTPVLMLVCGNPLLLGPKKPMAPNPVVTPTGQPEAEHPAPAPEAAPIAVPATPMPAQPDVERPEQPEYVPEERKKDNAAGLLLGLAALGFFIHTNDHNSCPPPPAVPEPMTLLVMGSGVAAMVARRRKQRG